MTEKKFRMTSKNCNYVEESKNYGKEVEDDEEGDAPF
jgi:hypothetical protein